MTTDEGFGDPTPSSIDIDRLLDGHLSLHKTAGLLALGMVGLAEFVLLVVLLVTEPEPLPMTTSIALGSVALAGLAWAIFAGWRLATRQVLLFRDRVVAAAMATLFTTSTAFGATAITFSRSDYTVAGAVGLGGAGLVAATSAHLRRSIVDHRRAAARLAHLQRSAST